MVLFLASAVAQGEPFGIWVVDEETGRGVPMVQLRPMHGAQLTTDSAGWIAFHEPGLMNSRVWFEVEADGYEHAEDAFGFRGVALDCVPGETATVTVQRQFAAERLYRLTGAGIYRDSLLLGKPVPVSEPLLNARVMGQDSALATVHNGRIHWFWGDTSRPEHPLGNFSASGATALLPADGGLSPSVGVDFHYFTRDDGFTRGVIDDDQEGAKWLGGLFTIADNDGRQRMVAGCARVRGVGDVLERTLVVWDDEREIFTHLAPMPLDDPLSPNGHTFTHTDDGREYIYFTTPYPMLRVPADWQSIQDPAAYEGFTCLQPGARLDKEGIAKGGPAIERDDEGAIVWAWKRDTPPVNAVEQRELADAGHITHEERYHITRDADTGGEINLWGGSVRWNPFLESWIMIAHELGGAPSMLGEVWLATAPTPEGPWDEATKIATHRAHDFYNVVHHEFLDEQDGRIIYFEGTLSTIFNDAPPIPRYDYNQIMYRLDLESFRD